MSETYSVWHAVKGDGEIRCYITAINVQELGKGDEQLVTQLLDGLRQTGSELPRWDVGKPFAVDHLSSGEGDDWRDLWLLTWPLTLKGVMLPTLPEEPEDVTAWDETWDGVEAVPDHLEIVAVPGDDAGNLDEDLGATRCPLGHAHIDVPTNDDPQAAAGAAKKVEERCREAGWSTRYLGTPPD